MKKNKTQFKLPAISSFEQVFGIVSKKRKFQQAYNQELLRLKLAKQIRALRVSRQMTQKMVAQKASMPQSVIARIETGDRGISVDTLGRVADAFGKQVELV